MVTLLNKVVSPLCPHEVDSNIRLHLKSVVEVNKPLRQRKCPPTSAVDLVGFGLGYGEYMGRTWMDQEYKKVCND